MWKIKIGRPFHKRAFKIWGRKGEIWCANIFGVFGFFAVKAE